MKSLSGSNIFIAVIILLIVFIIFRRFGAGALVDDSRTLSAREAVELIEQRRGDDGFTILDVRTPNEYNQGHIEGARLINIHSAEFSRTLGTLDKDAAYFVYCRSGNRSGRALSVMDSLGFAESVHLKGGIMAWQAAGGEIVQ